MCASVVARELDMELFRVDLSRVVSKWIGETEKNLGKVFDEAQRSNAIILFDETNALFARRTDASKIALAALVQALLGAGFRVIDCQQNTTHLASLGAREIPREQFLQIVSDMTSMTAPDWGSMPIALPEA